jgi:hypothetical protein
MEEFVHGYRDLQWSNSEKKAARKAFQVAYERECRAIRAKLKQMIEDDSSPRSIWRIHDYLSAQRRETEEKYDYRYFVLILVFAGLLKEGRLKETDLSGLQEDKIRRIKELASWNPCREGLA